MLVLALPEASRRLESVFAALSDDGDPSPVAETLHAKVKSLAAAMARGGEEEVRSSVRGIVGAGEGLTPAGDDMLVGLMGFLHLLRSDPVHGAFSRERLSWIAGTVQEGLVGTTPVAAHFLRAAARGRFTERVRDLLCSIGCGDEKGVEGAEARLLQYGATSGADLIAGMVIGAEAAASHE